jgi:hypothetical protein
VPADIIPGDLSILGKDYVVTQAYKTFYATTPYITLLTPATAQTGNSLEITGKNLPETPVQLIFEGQDVGCRKVASSLHQYFPCFGFLFL